jgi:hypothetical protein|tara:strand:- start:1880 stop:2266 length:387 start_codon:yes stop_codon:yes gene_type:complete
MSKDLKGQKLVKKLFQENDLDKSDIHIDKSRNFVIITRAGIEKIAAKNNLSCQFEMIRCERDFVVIKCHVFKGDAVMAETFASASADTSYSKYYVEMAEKRAMSRGILKSMNYYQYGIFGEDELNEKK